jgi:hypothetical protein
MTALEQFIHSIGDLNGYEQMIVFREAEAIANRLRIGIERYGHWNPATDSRNFVKEREEELLDGSVYLWMHVIASELNAGPCCQKEAISQASETVSVVKAGQMFSCTTLSNRPSCRSKDPATSG